MSPQNLNMLASIASKVGKGAFAVTTLSVFFVTIALAVEAGVIFWIILFLAASYLVGAAIEIFIKD